MSGRRTPPPEKVERMIQALGLSDAAAAEFRQAAAEAHIPAELLPDIQQLRAANRRLIDLVAHRSEDPPPLPRDQAMTADERLIELTNLRRVNRALLDQLDVAEGRKKRPRLVGVDHVPEPGA